MSYKLIQPEEMRKAFEVEFCSTRDGYNVEFIGDLRKGFQAYGGNNKELAIELTIEWQRYQVKHG